MSYVKQNDIGWEWEQTRCKVVYWADMDAPTKERIAKEWHCQIKIMNEDIKKVWEIWKEQAFYRNRIEENKKAYKYKPRYEHARARKKRLAKEATEGYTIDFNCLI